MSSILRSVSCDSVCSDVSASSSDTSRENQNQNPVSRKSGRYVLRPRKDGTSVKRYLYDKPMYNDNGSGGIIIKVYDNDDGEQCLPASNDEILYEDTNKSQNRGMYGYILRTNKYGQLVKRYLFKTPNHQTGRGVLMFRDGEGEDWTVHSSDCENIYFDK